ncbi:NifB/NifX family molybdenum-iron cluster-binding protein [bacterium]|nr:NifB/NifX family molybdenum-iron cluster-binding protein [bacterium]
MRICFPSEGSDLTSILSDRFGEAKYFIFVEDNFNKYLVKKNLKDGISPAQLVAEERPDAIVCGNIAPDYFDFLSASGIEIYSGVFGLTIRRSLDKLKKGELEENKATGKLKRGRLL